MKRFFVKLLFDPNGLIPSIARDIYTREVLMLTSMNKKGCQETIEFGEATY